MFWVSKSEFSEYLRAAKRSVDSQVAVNSNLMEILKIANARIDDLQKRLNRLDGRNGG